MTSDSFARLLDRHSVRRLKERFRPYEAAEPVASLFRARQLQAVLRLTPLTMVANALNVGLILLTFHAGGHALFLLFWSLAIAGVVVLGVRAWLRLRSRPTWLSASPRALRRATHHAALLGALWAALPLALFPDSDGPGQLLIATITTGMMCAGGFALATTPAAGTAYVLIVGLGAALSLFLADFPLALPVGALLLIYMMIVVASVWSTARLFGARLMAEAEAARQNELIGLLLRDFEENASDLLWEIDAQGRLCHVTPRLAALFAIPIDQLATLPVFELLERKLPADDEFAAEHLSALRLHAAGRVPFRDQMLAVVQGRRTHWWSLSAKPLVDANGRHAGWRGVASDVTEAQQANRQLNWMAHFDALTGLANRHQFRSQLEQLLTPAFGEMVPFAVLGMDLDHFKIVNDTHGHAAGDALLQEVARRLQACTRRSDTVARLGGDEFAVILRDVSSRAEADLLTRRLLDGVQLPCEVQGAHVVARISIGVAMAPKDGTAIDVLLNNADLALYAAKSAGRGDFRFFAPQMAAVTRRRLAVEQALRGALQRQELSLHFQPQVSLGDWRVKGFEALLRWTHPELGAVPPGEFVPVAEECGLIGEIGAWVVKQACLEAMQWPAGLTVAVNVSPVQAMSHELCRSVEAALQASGLPAVALELEITESVFLNETQATMQVLHALQALGLRIALDDFGTGYSSLAYLRRFPFDTLKIDRSFVLELLSRRDARAIVKTIVSLARTLDMKIVAEGVEDAAQAEMLQRYDCDSVQGYWLARPMTPPQVLEFLALWPAQLERPVAGGDATAAMPLEAGG
ncbi:PAS domain S-box-containing protein/diguanylate cyclase (GGDEF)-like protein [Roseateles toxinivorans]|uniref:PAS domain S-box-containing protein/diguanylate cyclase (GGDEF)-like protein n=1 Tax=Roseateles toxinivorans TaxID=270368 RepID=A0A4R6QGW7_9BURK|nr:PAS domain S-box-containing protein/diguanylate cyclase (GGDEF)-like protein [Roseateles toxinivorans]